jgi:hypothetical protein
MQQCRCASTHHDNHPGEPCDKQATTANAYCRECDDKSTKEHADTKPDTLVFQRR